MAEVNGPRHAKQLLTNARGMTRRVMGGLGVGVTGIPDWRHLAIALEDAERGLTIAIGFLDVAAKEQQKRERDAREEKRHATR
jgi:hypothetical protein